MLLALGLVLLALTLYMSTLSYALRSYSRVRLADRISETRRDRELERLDRDESDYQLVASTMRVIANLAVLVVACEWWWQTVGKSLDTMVLVTPALISTALLLVFSIGVPHALTLYAAEAVLVSGLPLLAGLRVVLWPVTAALRGTEFVVRRLLGKVESTEEEVSERVEQEILDAVSEGEAAGAVDEEQKEMIQSVIELGQTTVSAIMTPRTDIVAIPAKASYDEVRRLIVESGHSRIPVFENTIDHIIGVVYAKDLLRLEPGEAFDVRKVMRIAPYVPETKTIDELLNDFRESRVQIAIVLDEYGGTAGLATIEDILEEVVGEIDDEYDQSPAPLLQRINDDTLEVEGRVHVYEINQELGINLPEEGDYETIGGFVFATLGKIPAVGEEFTHENVAFRIIDAEPRRVKRLRIHVLREAGAA